MLLRSKAGFQLLEREQGLHKACGEAKRQKKRQKGKYILERMAVGLGAMQCLLGGDRARMKWGTVDRGLPSQHSPGRVKRAVL